MLTREWGSFDTMHGSNATVQLFSSGSFRSKEEITSVSRIWIPWLSPTTDVLRQMNNFLWIGEIAGTSDGVNNEHAPYW
jgi:hypothetical protein